jgi:DsbC/DsbD-like thiol-disulfide interchange protein
LILLTVQVNSSFTEKIYVMVFRRLLVCLLWLWLPVSQAADSGWLRAADNQHASVRLRAQTESNGDTRLLLDVALEKGWKTYWRSPGKAASRRLSPGTRRWR